MFKSILIDKMACNGCINCMKRCPTKAIRVVDGKAEINHARCINCGECVRVCQKKALHPNFDSFDKINNFKYKVAVPSASFFGQFGNVQDLDTTLNALRNVGFDDVFGVARGSDVLTALARRDLSVGKLQKPCISSSCPVCVELILMCFHGLKENLAPYIPASHIAAKMAREDAIKKTGLKSEEIGVFLISPCPAHVSAIKQNLYKNDSGIDGVFSVREVGLKVMNLRFDEVDIKANYKASSLGLSCAISGGAVEATGLDRVVDVDGMENVVKFVKELEDGKHPELEFVELNACPGGCVGGVMNVENGYFAKSTIIRLCREVMKGSQNVTDFADKTYDYYTIGDKWQVNNAYYKLDEDFIKAFVKMRKMEDVREQLSGRDCGMCGAPSCKDFAEDVAQGKANIQQCIFINDKND